MAQKGAAGLIFRGRREQKAAFPPWASVALRLALEESERAAPPQNGARWGVIEFCGAQAREKFAHTSPALGSRLAPLS